MLRGSIECLESVGVVGLSTMGFYLVFFELCVAFDRSNGFVFFGLC